MIVLAKMAIGTLHSLLEMNVCKVNRFVETVRIVESDLLAVFVQPIAFAVVCVDTAIDPSMPVEISKLRSLQFLVEFGAASLFQEFFIAPKSVCRGRFGIF